MIFPSVSVKRLPNPISLKAMHNLMRSGVDHIIQMHHHQIVEIMPMKKLLEENQL